MTLTELMIVVLIILFLVILVLAFFRNQLFKGNDARRKGDIHRIQVAIEEYEKDHDCYPLPQLVSCGEEGDGLDPYLSKIPCDPITKSSYFYEYENDACPSWYRLYTVLENTADSDLMENCGPGGVFNYFRSSPNAPGCTYITSEFYGCKSGVCVSIYWDNNRPGPECDPNYQSRTCYGQCGSPATECKPWNQ